MSENESLEGIAIIGMAGRFPGAGSVESFWQNLVAGVEAITHFTDGELAVRGPQTRQPNYVKARGVLADVELFDAAFFGMTPKEAELTDPQQRVFLECAWEALEQAGHDPEQFGGLIGVYAGCSLNTYLLHNLCSSREFIEQTLAGHQMSASPALLGNDKDFLATRVAYKLNLRGPCLAIQSACSTSLVAVVEACQSLLSCQCDLALAGGVSISFPQQRGYCYQEGAMVSSDGRCRPFDAAAEGTIFGGGVGVVALRRLADAVEAGDHIVAVLKGVALNNDGAGKLSYMAPSVDGQAAVIAMAQALAGFAPETIGYVEAHGTGTPLGDPVEIAGLTKAFRAGTSAKGFCGIGSVKGNVGHLESAAGVTGLIKTALAVQRGVIPPTLHFRTPNPKCEFEKSPFYVVSKLTEWKPGSAPRRAGVSSFGVGGTNAHVVLEEPPPAPASSSSRAQQLLVFSARTASALEAAQASLCQHLRSHPELSLPDVAFTLQTGRRGFNYRRALVCRELNEAIHLLGGGDPRKVHSQHCERRDPPVVFLFPGQGVQYVNMGRTLYETEPVLREEVDRCCALLEPHLKLDLRTVLYPPPERVEQAQEELTQTWLTQPALFVLEYALARLWMSWGVRPAAMLGHSVGEYVAACLAEVLSLEDALGLLAARARMMQALPGGSMLAVRAGESDVLPWLSQEVGLAAVNSPNLCVVSGPTAAVEATAAELKKRGVASKRLATSHAFHSLMMDPIAESFEAVVEQTRRNGPRIPYLSNLTARWITEAETRDARYWFRHLRQPVRFADGIAELAKEGHNLFLEVGPGQTLSALVRQHPARLAEQPVLASMPATPEGDEGSALLGAAARLWLAGVPLDWAGFHRAERLRRVPLPTYPFERKRHWIEPAIAPAPSPPVATQAAPVEAPPVEGATLPPACSPGPEPVQLPSSIPMSTTTSPTSRRENILSMLKTLFRDITGADQSEVSTSSNFMELGFDSLLLTQASQSIQSKLGVKVTFRQMMEDLDSYDTLAGFLEAKLPADASAAAAASAPVPVRSASPTAAPAAGAGITPGITPVLPGLPPALSGSGGGTSSNNSSLVERVIQQQMALMGQQLEVLRQHGAGVPPAMPGAGAAAPGQPLAPHLPAVTAVRFEGDTHKRFGPFKGVEKGPSGGLTSRQQKALDELVARYNKRTARSKALAQAHRAHFCDPRAAGNFRQLWKEMVYPIACARSKGSRIWDIDGNEYLDVTMGFGTNYLGHSPDFVMEALERQMKQGVEIGPQSPLAGEVAQMICELTGMERVTFCNTGSEGVMAALRVARTVSARSKVVYFYGDYHGIFDEVLARPALVDGLPGAMPIAPGIPHLANVMVLEYGSPKALETIKAHAGEIAAVLVEPIQSRHPDLQPRAFLKELRAITEEREIALIFDEVITGFRVAPGGAQEYFGVRADLATYGKVVGGGMPIGVLAGKAKYMDALDGGFWQYGDDSSPPTGVTFFAGTFVRHPLAMAAAHAVLRFLQSSGPALQAQTTERTARFVRRLNSFLEERRLPIRLQTFSALFYYDFHPDLSYASLLFYYLRDRGVHIWEGRVGCLSIAHTDQDMDLLFRAFQESIIEMQAADFLPRTDPATAAPAVQPPEPGAGARVQTDRASGAGGISAEARVASDGRLAGRAPLVGAGAPAAARAGDKSGTAGTRFPLTDGQKEMWLAAQIGPEASGANNGGNTVRLCGKLDPTALRRAVAEVILRHEALRCVFSEDGSEVVVRPSVTVDLPLEDLSGLAPAEREAAVTQILEEEGRRIFDLARGPLFSFRLVKLGAEEHLLLLTVQMIICDGWSYTVLLEDLSAIYTGLVEGRPAALPPGRPLRDYVLWQEQQQNGAQARQCEEFWVSQFGSVPPPLDLCSSRPRPPIRSFAGARESLRLSAEFHQALKQTAKRLKSTPFGFLLAAYQTWLHRLSGAGDLVVGVPFAGQGGAGMETLVGQCVQTLPLRVKLEAEEHFPGLVGRTRGLLLDGQEHWNYSFGRLVQKLSLPADRSRMPLVSVLFNLDLPMSKVHFAGCQQSVAAIPRFYFQYDLGFNLVDEGGPLLVECDFNPRLFDPATIRCWLGGFQALLEGIIADPDRPLSRLPMLPESERRQRIVERNATDCSWSSAATLHELVAAQAARTPGAVALEWEGRALTYGELEQMASQLSNHLRGLEVKAGTLVAVCLERSIDMVAGLLAILKTGGAYVPIDPDYPPDRMAAILADTGAPVLLTQAKLLPRLPETKARLVCLDEDRNVIGRQDTTVSAVDGRPEDLAYVIYTSGSTGKAKGVEIFHRAVVNLLESMRRQPGLTADDVVLALANLTFDIAVLEIFLPLVTGARVVIVPRATAIDPAALARTIEACGVTVMQATPATWRMLLNAGWPGKRSLKVLCGGEALKADLAGSLLQCCGEVWNMYGPTETTVWSTVGRVERGAPISLGHPIANTRVYLTDEQLQVVPVGVPGELLIGGAGLARGYRHQPELTASKFVPDPFAQEPEARLFRTGDLARYRPDGEIEFIGRLDLQVKIRGCRIELGEIEAVLSSHPQVKEAVAVAREEASGQSILVAYVVASEDSGKPAEAGGAPSLPLAAQLRQLLRSKVPECMVPSCFVRLDALPRTAHGKVDRSALPPPGQADLEVKSDIVAPRNATEKILARIWSETLKISRISVRDNFFDLGGQSLVAVSLFERIERELGRKLPLATLFRAPTIEELAAELAADAGPSAGWPSLVPVQPKGSQPPLFLVHGAGGNVLLYRTLGQSLGSDIPLYGLQSQGLDGKSAPLRTIEAMASRYLEEIRGVQAHGPYLLGGYCMGGTIAYEMAQMLLARGEEVGLLALLDTYEWSQVVKPGFVGLLRQKAAFHLRNVLRLGPKDWLGYLANKLQVARSGEFRSLLQSISGAFRKGGEAAGQTSIEASIQGINDTAAEAYRPKPYPGLLTLFKPRVNYDFYPDPKMGWGDLATGGLEIVELPINPHAMLVQPYVRELVRELRARLLRAPAKARTAAGVEKAEPQPALTV